MDVTDRTDVARYMAGRDLLLALDAYEATEPPIALYVDQAAIATLRKRVIDKFPELASR